MKYRNKDVGELEDIGSVRSIYNNIVAINKEEKIESNSKEIIMFISDNIISEGNLKIRGNYVIDGEEVPKKDYWNFQIYNVINKTGSNRPKCVICKKNPAVWNRDKIKYSRLCSNHECRKKYVETFEERMKSVHGAKRLLDRPDHQVKMMKARGIAKEYTFSTGEVETMIGKMELKGVEILDRTCKIKRDDMEIPASTVIKYKNPKTGEIKNHIPDMYIKSLNLLISFKDGLDNPNNHPNFQKDRYKSILQYITILRDTDFNFIQIEGEEDLKELPAIIKSCKDMYNKGGRYIIPPRIDFMLYKEAMTDKEDTRFITEKDLESFHIINDMTKFTFNVAIGRNINETHPRTHLNPHKDIVMYIQSSADVILIIENGILRTDILDNVTEMFIISEEDFSFSFNIINYIDSIYQQCQHFINVESITLSKDYLFRILYNAMTGYDYDSLDIVTYEDILDFIDVQGIKINIKNY